MDEVIINTKITDTLKEISLVVDYISFNRIINKLTDYSEILTEGKLASLINFNYRLNASQANMVIDLLLEIQALSKIYATAQKGKKDLDVEFISNVFSDVNNPSSAHSLLSIRNEIEGRLNSQLQQYNLNMNKGNTTIAVSINELYGHVKTFVDLTNNNVSASNKARLGYIMGSLHDSYVIILNKFNWWDDKTYLKFFFNDDNPSKRNLNLLTKEPRQTIFEIGNNVKKILEFFKSISIFRTNKNEQEVESRQYNEEVKPQKKETHTVSFSDKLLSTPFGMQYGQKIDSIIRYIFTTGSPINSEHIKRILLSLFQAYKQDLNLLNSEENRTSAVLVVGYLLNQGQDYGLKRCAEDFLYQDRKIIFAKFFADNKDVIEEFFVSIFVIFFEERFNPIFRIVKSPDMRQYACAFIVKRIYLIQGENLPVFGYFLIKTIASAGK